MIVLRLDSMSILLFQMLIKCYTIDPCKRRGECGATRDSASGKYDRDLERYFQKNTIHFERQPGGSFKMKLFHITPSKSIIKIMYSFNMLII